MGEKYPVALIKLTAESPMMVEFEYDKVWRKETTKLQKDDICLEEKQCFIGP